MVFMKKFAIICCIMCGVLLINGCSEGSASFEQKSSVEVSTSSGVNYSSSYTESRTTSGPLILKLNDANILDGKVEIYVSITNNGKRDTTLDAMTLNFVATDSNGKEITNGSTHFDSLSINLPVGKEVYQLFVIENPEYKRFDDSFHIDCNLDHIKVNPDIE